MTRDRERAIQVLTTLKNAGFSIDDLIIAINLSEDIKRAQKENASERIRMVFKKLSIPMNTIGYEYLKRGVELAYKDEVAYRKNLMKGMYSEIAKDFGTTSSRVERMLRYTIEKMCESVDLDFYNKIFGNVVPKSKDNPAPKEFFIAVVEYLKMEDEKFE